MRPYKLEAGDLHFEGTNALFNMMSHLAAKINDDRYKINRKSKPKSQLLFNLQKKYMELDEEINQILSGKKGSRISWSTRVKALVKNFLNCWKAKYYKGDIKYDCNRIKTSL